MEHKSPDIFELISVIYKSRKLIIAIVVIAAIAAVIYSLVTPEIFTSRASFYAVGDSGSELPINIPGLTGISANLLGIGGSANTENYIDILRSRTFGEDAIRKFNLVPYFKLTHADSLRNMDKALMKLSQNVMSFGYNKSSGLVGIQASTKDKQLSLNLVNHYLEKLDEYNRTQKVSKSKLNRIFLEQRVSETKQTLDSLIIENRKFQEGSKAIHLESQAKGIIDAYGSVIADKMKADIELELALANYGDQSPIIANLLTKKAGLEKQIKDLEKSGNTPDYLINIGKIPAVTSQYARIQMNMEIYKTLFSYLYPQYEAAKLSELRDMPTIEMLDNPRLAGVRDRPKRAVICIMVTLIAFVFAIFVAILKEVFVRNRKKFLEITGHPEA